VKVTSIGHAGLYVETRAGTITCDPWFNPAYFASWVPFPANDHLDPDIIGAADYLYVSHLHLDHFDPAWLTKHMNKDATVLLPGYALPHLKHALEELGFSRFVETISGQPTELDGGLRVMIVALSAPNDGPIGDSCLAVDDGTARILNMNDARPPDLEVLANFGHFDAHWLQFSGAIWYPVVYDLPERAKVALGEQKRRRGLERAHRYVKAIGADHVFPHAGPPAFLDDDLFEINDFGQPGNPFPDTPVFLDYLGEQGHTSAHLLLPGSSVELNGAAPTIRHAGGQQEIDAIYGDKRGYLEAYQERWRPRIEAERASWPVGVTPLFPEVKAWFEPLMDLAQHLCARLGERVLLDTGQERIVLDFQERRVIVDDGQPCRYEFMIDDTLVRACVDQRLEDWVNSLFLSCRFRARRKGPYNEHVYTWFKALSEERARYVEDWLTEDREIRELWRFDDWLVQRRCPHLSADLAQFGHLEGAELVCDQHGWRFDLATGRCLTSDDVSLYAVPVGTSVGDLTIGETAEEVAHGLDEGEDD
jgi:UDP-MurNAc hydroxylase